MAEESKDKKQKPLLPYSVERGTTGVRQYNGAVLEEADRDLRGGNFIRIVELMKKDPVVSAPISLYRMMLGKPKWTVKPTDNSSKSQSDKSALIYQMINDMEHSWFSFIREVSSMIEYGFSVHEIVDRKSVV